MRHALTRRAMLRLIGLAGLGTLLTGTLALGLPERHRVTGNSERPADDAGVTMNGWLLNSHDR